MPCVAHRLIHVEPLQGSDKDDVLFFAIPRGLHCQNEPSIILNFLTHMRLFKKRATSVRNIKIINGCKAGP
ncbi:MAG: hypothetical protein B7C24_17825 [Bacteroidetes bacterium 4572_77]|nr:MAG: hypothetical protein B7C24_17825 [Bacteroidetes bacterium 4572_77]